MISKPFFTKTLMSIFVFATIAFSGTGYAEDTDIYLKPRSIPRDDSPNVLIIFDNSGSMEGNVLQVQATFDPTTDYSAFGSFDKDKVYFTTDGSTPTTPGDDWIWAADNACTASDSNLDMVAGALGEWSGPVAVWKWEVVSSTTSTTKGGWADITGNGGVNVDNERKIKHLECTADSPIESGYVYLQKGTNKDEGARYTNTDAQEKDLSGLSSPTLFSGNYLNFKNGTAATIWKTRMEVAKEVVNNLIDTTENVRFGLMAFNANYDGADDHNAARVVVAVDEMTAARKTTFKDTVNQMMGWFIPPDPVGSCDYAGTPPASDLNCTSQMIRTPLAESLYEAYRYFGGLSVMYGDDAKATEVPVRDTSAEDGSGTYVSPFNYACQKAFIIMITDGDPRNDDDVDTQIEGLTGGSYGGDDDADRLPDLAGYMANNDINPVKTGTQTAKIYTIGFQSDQALLQNTATQGQGEYYVANDYDALKDSLRKVVSNIVNTTASFNAPTLSVNAFNSLYNRDEVYFSMFLPETTAAWPGNLKKYTLCTGTETAANGVDCFLGEIIDKNNDLAIDPTTRRIKGDAGDSTAALSHWSSSRDGSTTTAGGAGEFIPVPSSRNIYTYGGSYNADKRTPADTADLSATVNLVHPDTSATDLTPALFGAADKTERDVIIRWMLGDTDDDLSTTADKRWAFHDPLHARPVAITYGALNCDAAAVLADGCTLNEPNPEKPIIKMIAATNDGGIRFIDEATGVEEWVMVPQEKLKPLQANLQANGSGNHLYGIDSTPTFLIYDNNNNGIIEPASPELDRVYMFIGERRGGSNLYGFNLTPVGDMDGTGDEVKPELMWVIKGGTNPADEITTGYEKLGQTWSQPRALDIQMKSTGGSQKQTVLIVGGGYDPDQDNTSGNTDDLGNAIFIINPLTGERIWWASNTGSGANLEVAGMDYSVPSQVAAMDTDGDGARDRLYVGDVGGQVLRIDLSSTISVGADGTPTKSFGYVLAKLSDTTLQEKRKFFYRPSMARVNETTYSSLGRYDIIALASGDRTDPLDNQTLALDPAQDEIRNKIYAIRDENTATGPASSAPTAILQANLYDATSDVLLDDSTSNCTSTKSDALKGAKGWFIELIDQNNTTVTSDDEWVGEKSLARTVILDGWLYVTSYVPPSTATAQQTCAANEGAGRLHAIPILSGGYCGIGVSVDLGGGIPPEISVITREEGQSALVGTNECLTLPECCQRNDPRPQCKECILADGTWDPTCTKKPTPKPTFWFEK